MEIGLSSAVFYPKVNTEDSFKLINKLGFSCVEIFLNSPCEYEESFINKLVELKYKHNISVNSVHSFSSSFEPYLFDSYGRRRKDMMKYFKMLCKAGSTLNASCYTFHGMRLVDSRFADNKLIYDVYNELTYTASEYNIKLAQENVSWCMSSDLEYLTRIKEKTKYPLYFTLDLKQAYKAKVEPSRYLEIMGKDLVNFHVNDNNKTSACLLPGKGEVNYYKLFNELRKIGYNGNAIIEIYSDNYNDLQEIKNSKDYLEKFLN